MNRRRPENTAEADRAVRWRGNDGPFINIKSHGDPFHKGPPKQLVWPGEH